LRPKTVKNREKTHTVYVTITTVICC